MKAWQVDFGGGLGSLRATELPTPTPGPGEVLVRVESVSLNRREDSILRGRYPLPVKPTLIPACDGAGVVTQVGSRVHGVVAGDRVVAGVFPQWRGGDFDMDTSAQLGGSLDGTLAEYLCVDARAVVAIPACMSFEQASTLPCAGVTAWNALATAKLPAEGGTVLSLTAGVVSTFAVQLAAARGATVLVGTATPQHDDQLRTLGAQHVFVRSAGLVDDVMDITNGRGVDLVVHNYGSLAESVAAARVAGQVSLVSIANAGQLDPVQPFVRNVTIRPITVGSIAQTRALVDFVSERDLATPICAVFRFESTRDAFAAYLNEPSFGKIIINRQAVTP